MPGMTEIAIEPKVSEELNKLQQELAQAQGQIAEVVLALAAYGALPAALQQLAQKLASLASQRDEQIKKVAALAGVDLEAPDAGRWSWVMHENVIRKVG
jgi:hypothetical protein